MAKNGTWQQKGEGGGKETEKDKKERTQSKEATTKMNSKQNMLYTYIIGHVKNNEKGKGQRVKKERKTKTKGKKEQRKG